MNHQLNELIELRDIISSSIDEELSQYDLEIHDQEFDCYFPISFNNYPSQLKDFLKSAWEELEKIDFQIEQIKDEPTEI